MERTMNITEVRDRLKTALDLLKSLYDNFPDDASDRTTYHCGEATAKVHSAMKSAEQDIRSVQTIEFATRRRVRPIGPPNDEPPDDAA